MMLAMTAVLLAACWGNSAEHFAPEQDRQPAQPSVAAAAATTLTPSRDGHITSTHPDRNSGAKDSMDVARPLRTLIAFDQAAIAAAVGSGQLQSATLRLTIGRTADNWGPNWRTIDLHRMQHAWTETGATWHCAIDAVPTNQVADCSGETEWDMRPASGLWAQTRTAQAFVTNDLTGVIEFDVTADVLAFLAGAPNEGWVIKKTNEERQGRIVFLTRESSSPPQLILQLAGTAEWPLLTTSLPRLDTTKTVELLPGGAKYYRTEATLLFVQGTSDTDKRLLFEQFHMSVIGVTHAGNFYVRFPDPGPSIADYRAFADQVNADPKVKAFAPLSFGSPNIHLDARYPNDAHGLERPDWISGTASTWAHRALRSPLAWGCETGTYGGGAARIGAFEWKHERNHPDYAAQVARSWSPSDSDLAQAGVSPAPLSTALAWTTHGTNVVGAATAQGDNALGVAGTIWRSLLFLYSGASGGDRALNIEDNFYAVADQVIADNLHVLTISAGSLTSRGSSPQERFRSITRVAEEVARLLTTSPKLLIVAAAGNDRNRSQWRSRVQNIDTVGVVRMAVLQVRENPQFADRVIIVTGTEPSGGFWNSLPSQPLRGADYYPGITDLAAPAQDVTVLGYWTGQQGTQVPLATVSGTSIAAPLVAGIAAQLYTMDPTLTPAEVKSLILRGAQVSRFDSTGARVDSMALRIPVPGTSDYVYQADAYGALQLLSRERPGTPICGVSVWADGALHIDRDAPEVHPGPYHVTSVAQGGRLLTVMNEYYRLSGGVFSFAGSDPDAYEIYFTERDTIYTRVVQTQNGNANRHDLFVRIGSHYQGRSRNEINITGVFPSSSANAGFNFGPTSPFSPTSDWAFVSWNYDSDEYQCTEGGSLPQGGGSYLIPLRPGLSQYTFHTWQGNRCDLLPGTVTGTPIYMVGWRDAGDQLIGAASDGNTTLRRYLVGTGAQQVGPVVNPLWGTVGWIHWVPGAGRVETREYESGPCEDVVRSTTSLQVLSTSTCTGTWPPFVPLLRTRPTMPAVAKAAPLRLGVEPIIGRERAPLRQQPTRFN